MKGLDEALFLLWTKSYEILPGKVFTWGEVIQSLFERPILLIASVIFIIGWFRLIFARKR